MDQVKDKAGVASYQEVKEMAHDRDKWKKTASIRFLSLNV